jgi:hypothetical protein
MRNWPLMTWFARSVSLLIPVVCAFGQDAGVTAAWDVKARMTAMAEDVGRLEDLLRRTRPNEWVEKGAPDAYFRQLESARTNMQVLIAGTEKLAKDPERLSTALDVLFRMDTMDLLLQSLQGAVRKYQGPSLADDIARFIADNSRHRDMLRQHSIDLAAARENDLKVINAEAQRCRTELSRKDAPETQPQPQPRTSRRRTTR